MFYLKFILIDFTIKLPFFKITFITILNEKISTILKRAQSL